MKRESIELSYLTVGGLRADKEYLHENHVVWVFFVGMGEKKPKKGKVQ